MRKKPISNELKTQILAVIFPALAFVGGMAVNALSIAEKIATKPYVDDKALELKHYTDDKAVLTLKDANNYSDFGKQQIMLELEKHTSTMETIKVKLDLMQKTFESRH